MWCVMYMQVFDHYSLIATVSNQANHEAALEKMLRKVSICPVVASSFTG